MEVEKRKSRQILPMLVAVAILAAAVVAYMLLASPASSVTTETSSSAQSTSISPPSVTAASSTSSGLASVPSSSASSSTPANGASTTSIVTQGSTSISSGLTTGTSYSAVSTATTQTTSCYTEATANGTVGLAMVAFFKAYSSMSSWFQGTKDGNKENLNLSYAVVSASSTEYRVNVDYTLNGAANVGTIWLLSNGTVLAGELNGNNHTGSAASTFVLNAFTGLDTIYNLALQASTIGAFFHSVGTSTVTMGSSTFTVADYVANATPETVQGCDGSSALIDSYNVHLGTPSGASLEMVTSATFSVTLMAPTESSILDYTYQLTALTVA